MSLTSCSGDSDVALGSPVRKSGFPVCRENAGGSACEVYWKKTKRLRTICATN